MANELTKKYLKGFTNEAIPTLFGGKK